MALGTAPRRIGGVWVTRTGRRLTEAGQGYWENLYRTGRTSGTGRMTQPHGVAGKPSYAMKPTPAAPRPAPMRRAPAPSHLDYALAQAASQGQVQRNRPDVRAAQARVRTYQAQSRPAGWQRVGRAIAGGLVHSITDPLEAVGKDIYSQERNLLTGHPHREVERITAGRGATSNLMNEWIAQPALRTGRAVSQGRRPGALDALALASILPFGRTASALGRGAEAAGIVTRRPLRTLTIGERTVQIPSRSQNPLSQALLDRPADWLSSRVPNLPVAGSRARALRHAGRGEVEEIRRAKVALAHHISTLPERGSHEDVAHFWWAQLPTSMRNREGLQAVRNRLAGDLQDITTTPAKGALAVADRPQRAKDLSAAIARMDQVIEANPSLNPRTIDAVSALSGARKQSLIEAGILDPEQAAAREQLVTRWATGARYEPRTPGKLGRPSAGLVRRRSDVERLQGLYDRAIERSGVAVEKSRPPLSRPQAVERLGQLETQHENLVQAAISRIGGGAGKDVAEIRRRNIERAKYRKGKRLSRPKLISEESRQAAIDKLDELAGRNAHEPWAKAYIAQRDEISRLRQQIAETEPGLGERKPIRGEFGRTEHPTRSVYDPTVTRLGGALSVAKDRLAQAEAAAARRVKPTGVLGGRAEEGGGEIFIGHRPDTPRGAFGIRSIGTGKARPPQGVGQENKMELLSSGRVRMSTHVAGEDALSSQTYQDTTRIRRALHSMGEPLPHVEGEISDRPIEGMMIINPEGKPVPRGWNTDRLAQLSEGGGGDELHGAAREVLQTATGDSSNWQEIVQAAKDAGIADQLRMLPEKDVERFYRQFLPLARQGAGLRTYDKLIDATAASLIFARLGYIPKNIAQNLIMAVPHQGPRIFGNAARAAQLSPVRPGRSELDAQLWRELASEVGGGPAGSVAKEFGPLGAQTLGRPAQAVTGIADTPLRVSALIHEFANKGVIPKWSSHLTDEDKVAMLDFLRTETNRGHLNEATQTARDAMGDFERMSPAQRRLARRFLIVPGWLAAGTRYPAKFATSYPGRTAALAYMAAGEPGAGALGLPQNRPAWDYLAPGLPSFMQGVKTGPDSLYRVSSMLPASLPADIGLGIAQGHPLKAAGYANPLPETLLNIARSQIETSSGETRNVPFLQALTRGVERLAPSEAFLRDIIAGPKGAGLYPSKSRIERLKRESGILPVKYDPTVAERMRAAERGETKTTKALSDQQDLIKALDAAGYEPDQALSKAFRTKIERAKRLDQIHAHGLSYQQKAYRSDVQYALKLGAISKVQAQEMLDSLDGAAENEIDNARREMARAYFGGDTIAEAKKQLKQATAQPAAG